MALVVAPGSAVVADAAGFTCTESRAGTLRLRAQSLPAADVTAQYYIAQQEGFTMAFGPFSTHTATDATLTAPHIPADAAAVGAKILDENKNVVFYTKTQMDERLEQCKKDALLAAYPVGKLWISNDPTSPASIVGGTWERVKDVFILAAGDTFPAGTTGGRKSAYISKLNLPSIFLPITIGNKVGSMTPKRVLQYADDCTAYWNGNTTGSLTEGNTLGGGDPIDIMPPFVAMYVWQRVA